MNRLLHIFLLIFREFIIYTQLFTLLSIVIFLQTGWKGLPLLFWTKAVGFLSVCGLFYFSKRNQLVFYHNLGLSTRRLVFTAATADLAFCSLLLAIIALFR